MKPSMCLAFSGPLLEAGQGTGQLWGQEALWGQVVCRGSGKGEQRCLEMAPCSHFGNWVSPPQPGQSHQVNSLLLGSGGRQQQVTVEGLSSCTPAALSGPWQTWPWLLYWHVVDTACPKDYLVCRGTWSHLQRWSTALIFFLIRSAEPDQQNYLWNRQLYLTNVFKQSSFFNKDIYIQIWSPQQKRTYLY